MATPWPSIVGKRPDWLLEWNIFGSVFRIATSTLTVTDARGRSLQFVAGLQTPTPAGDDDSIPIGFDAGGHLDCAKLRARGVMLERTSAILRRYFAGQTLEAAEVVAFGEVVDVAYGSASEPVELSIAKMLGGAESMYPPADAAITSDTWPLASSSASLTTPADIIGTPYPIVIGRPGPLIDLGNDQPTTPAYLVEQAWTVASQYANSKLLIAGHEVVSTTVRVYDLSDGTMDVRTVQHAADKLGRRCAYIDWSSVSNYQMRANPEHEFGVSWYIGATSGGMYNFDRSGALRGLGDVLYWALDLQKRYPFDRAAQIGQRDLLNVFAIDTFIAGRVDLLDWVDQKLASLFPIRRRWGPGGIYYEAIRFALAAPQTTALLNVDDGRIVRLGSVRGHIPAEGIANEITLRFAPSLADGFLKQFTITAAPPAVTDSRVVPNLLCNASQAAYGVRSADIEADTVWDPTTALLLLETLARRRALPTEVVAYQGNLELERFRMGDAVRVTDAEMYYSSRVAVVTDSRTDGDVTTLELTLEPDPTLIARSTT